MSSEDEKQVVQSDAAKTDKADKNSDHELDSADLDKVSGGRLNPISE